MKNVDAIQFYTGSKEEVLPGFREDFPYIASRVVLDNRPEASVPWHWHKAIEVFYIESGALTYYTPGGQVTFPAGSGGIVNSNSLHMTKAEPSAEKTVQLLHIFDTALLSGEPGSRIETTYIAPILSAPQLEIMPLFPEDPAHAKIIQQIAETFQIMPDTFGYEIRLRDALSDIWLSLFKMAQERLANRAKPNKSNETIKLLMVYIHEHYAEKIAVADLAAAAYVSERECFRVFRDCLHMTPVEYIRHYRLQMACQLLIKSNQPITRISHSCGLENSSYFGRLFREHMGCTPSAYRRKWQDCDK